MGNSRGGPYLVREELPIEPGVHSHNSARRAKPVQKRASGSLRALRITLFLLGIAAVLYLIATFPLGTVLLILSPVAIIAGVYFLLNMLAESAKKS